MGEIRLFEAVVKFVDGCRFAGAADGRNERVKRAIEFWTGACKCVKQRPRRRHHDEAVPQAAAQLQHLRQEFVGLLPKTAYGENLRPAVDRAGRLDPAVLDFRRFGLDAEQNYQLALPLREVESAPHVRHEF